jgi:hypothetical protein
MNQTRFAAECPGEDLIRHEADRQTFAYAAHARMHHDTIQPDVKIGA